MIDAEIAVLHVVDDDDSSPLHFISAGLLAYYQECERECEDLKQQAMLGAIQVPRPH